MGLMYLEAKTERKEIYNGSYFNGDFITFIHDYANARKGVEKWLTYFYYPSTYLSGYLVCAFGQQSYST